MFQFGDNKNTESVEKEQPSTHNTSIGDLLKHIDAADYKYYDQMTDKEKKEFTPYTVLRWVSSLDDSIQVTYPSSTIEKVFGKWRTGGKEVMNDLVAELNKQGINVVSVSKYNHSDFDWRIKFAVQGQSDANKLIDEMHTMGIKGEQIITLVDSTTVKYQLIMLNDMVNDGFWEMKDHPELIYQLLCSVQDMLGKQEKPHNWINYSKSLKNVNSELFDLMKSTVNYTVSTQLNEDEYKILLFQYDKQSFQSLLESMGYQDKDSKSMMKIFKEECKKYGKEM